VNFKIRIDEFINCCSDWSSWAHIWNLDIVDLHPLLYLCIQPWK